MKIIEIQCNPLHEVKYRCSGQSGEIKFDILPFYHVLVDKLPTGLSSFIVTSDLQGREINKENRLLGEVVAEELVLLQELNMTPDINLVILAGDLYDYPDCRKLRGTGDVTSVWNAFASSFEHVIGVHGNHDMVQNDALKDNIIILDGTVTHCLGIQIGGVSGILGREDRNQRKNEQQFEKALLQVLSAQSDLIVLHQGPDDPMNGQIGEPLVRTLLEKNGDALVVSGHCHWDIPLAKIGSHQVLNVDNRLYLFSEQKTTL